MGKSPAELPDSKEKILTAAAEEFADKGFSGARVDEIARRAGLNKALLYYHMGDKATLYSQVILTNLARAKEVMQTAVAGAEDAEARFRAVVLTVAGMVREAPYLPRLLLREAASGGRNLPDEVVAGMGSIFTTIQQVLLEGVARKSFRRVDPLLTHFMIAGSILFLTVSQPLRQRLGTLEGLDLDAEVSVEEIADHVSTLLLKGLLLSDEEPEPPAEQGRMK